MIFKDSHPVLVLLSAWWWVGLFGYLSNYTGLQLFVGFLIGFCSYTFNEYFIHCVLFHIISLRVKWPSRLYYKVHGRHHKFPEQYNRVVLPIAHQWGLVFIQFNFWYGLIMVIEVVQGFSGLTIFDASFRFRNTCILGSGLMFGYSLYEIAHLFGHGYPLLKSFTFLEYAKWFHMYHHTNMASRNYGFVSPFWDWVFGTICNEEELNPFIKPHFGWTPMAILSALPIPVPFYHFIMLWIRNHGYTFGSYGREKQNQVEFFG